MKKHNPVTQEELDAFVKEHNNNNSTTKCKINCIKIFTIYQKLKPNKEQLLKQTNYEKKQ